MQWARRSVLNYWLLYYKLKEQNALSLGTCNDKQHKKNFSLWHCKCEPK